MKISEMSYEQVYNNFFIKLPKIVKHTFKEVVRA